MSNKNNEWPKTLWILTGDDIAKGIFKDEYDRYCLSGWIRNQFLEDDPKADLDKDGTVSLEFTDALRFNLVKLGSNIDIKSSIPAHNDIGGLSYDQLAQAWNMTLADFGYIEIDKSEWKDYE